MDELDKIALRIADETCLKINYAAQTVCNADDMPYPAQYILEEVIKKLQERV